MIHEVLKEFRGEGRVLKPGVFVETAHWRNEKYLIDQGKIGFPRVPQDQLKNLKPVNVTRDTKDSEEEKVEAKKEEQQTNDTVVETAASSNGGEPNKRPGNFRGRTVPRRIPPKRRGNN